MGKKTFELSTEKKAPMVIELRRKGATYRQIAKWLNISVRDISKILKEHEIKGYAERIEERLAKLEEKIDGLAKIVRTGFASSGVTFICPFCGNLSKFVYDKSKKLCVCKNCGKTI